MSRRIPSKAVHHGENAEHVAYKDDRYVRCKHCGFICHLDRDQRARRGSHIGDGIVHAGWADYDRSQSTYDGTDDDWTDNTWTYDGGMNDFKVKKGCPFCGCLLYYE